MIFKNIKKILCCECYKLKCVYRCNNCNKYLCDNFYCGFEYPHINNQIFNICISCINEIAPKLQILKYKKVNNYKSCKIK